MEKIVYKPFIANPQPTEDPIKTSLTTPQPNIIVPKQEIIQTIEPYKPQFEFDPQPQKRGQVFLKDNNIKLGNTGELIDKLTENGISFRVTSGYREGAKTKQGNNSWHSQGYALDITPIEGQTFDDLKNALKSKPELVKWLQDNDWGIIDETTPSVLKRTGGSGAH